MKLAAVAALLVAALGACTADGPSPEERGLDGTVIDLGGVAVVPALLEREDVVSVATGDGGDQVVLLRRDDRTYQVWLHRDAPDLLPSDETHFNDGARGDRCRPELRRRVGGDDVLVVAAEGAGKAELRAVSEDVAVDDAGLDVSGAGTVVGSLPLGWEGPGSSVLETTAGSGSPVRVVPLTTAQRESFDLLLCRGMPMVPTGPSWMEVSAVPGWRYHQRTVDGEEVTVGPLTRFTMVALVGGDPSYAVIVPTPVGVRPAQLARWATEARVVPAARFLELQKEVDARALARTVANFEDELRRADAAVGRGTTDGATWLLSGAPGWSRTARPTICLQVVRAPGDEWGRVPTDESCLAAQDLGGDVVLGPAPGYGAELTWGFVGEDDAEVEVGGERVPTFDVDVPGFGRVFVVPGVSRDDAVRPAAP